MERDVGDGDLIPISDAQAELAKEAIRAVKDLAAYGADILGDAPKDLVGWLFGDRIKVRRAANLAALWSKTEKTLERQGIVEPEAPNPKLAYPILAAAADETSEELQDLWARLLAAAMNPTKSSKVRIGYSEALRKFDPLDVRVLQHLFKSQASFPKSKLDDLAGILRISTDELQVSWRNLASLGITSSDEVHTLVLMPFGRELMRTVSD